MKAVVSIYQDTRHKKRDNTYPVKIRVYDQRTAKLYKIGVDLTEADFQTVRTAKKLTGELLKKNNTIEAERLKATDIIDKMTVFTHKEFERKFKSKGNSPIDVFHYYDERIKELQELEQIKTSIIYLHASDSFRRFLQPPVNKINPARKTEDLRNDKSIVLPFAEVNHKWLTRYQKWMQDNENGATTISMYLRTLRTIFNLAISDKEISPELYPFGRDMFAIPTGSARKQTFQKEDLQKILRTLWNYETGDPLITKARDFWFFIYNAYGMNARDIVLLRDTNIIGSTIFFRRQKTKNTTKREIIIDVPITKHMQDVFEMYGQTGKGYIFDVLRDGMTEVEKVAASDAFTTFINDHMERLCKLAGVTISCTTYTARHLFGTMAIRNGAPTALVQKAFGHQSILTTENYIGEFDEEAKRKVSTQLMNF